MKINYLLISKACWVKRKIQSLWQEIIDHSKTTQKMKNLFEKYNKISENIYEL